MALSAREGEMRSLAVILVVVCSIGMMAGQEKAEEGPANEKAQKTYHEALQYQHDRRPEIALDFFKKADKQDDGHCLACQKKMIKYGIEFREWKTAETAGEEMVQEAHSPKEIALAHYQFGVVLLNEGVDKHKDEIFNHCHDEMTKALAAFANFPDALYIDGRALGYLKQDDAAKASFQQFLKLTSGDTPDRQRAQRYVDDPELARARLAPPFAVTTMDGQRISLDDLTGKVVLLDFWATWCGPCRAALPHMREISKKFEGQPLIVLSVSVDTDEGKWKEFVAKNEMTWPQYLDHGFTGPVAKLFGVQAIPHTFTIDSDGVMQDEHIGDASIEGKLKKLIRRAQESQTAQTH
jgi:thiol-disulfide isomerase/thioredoxin